MRRWAIGWLLLLGACNLIGGIESAELECSADGMKNGRETGVDCGGPCTPCPDYQTCATDADCSNRVCEDGTCTPGDCYDGRQNGSESDVDCGGDSELCERCFGGQRCNSASDCAAGVSDPDACQDGRCKSLCCHFDCEGCGGNCPDDCGPGSLGASCEVEDCLDPFWCLETESFDYICL